jgi:NAD(P) transhydrogenase subunit alpha
MKRFLLSRLPAVLAVLAVFTATGAAQTIVERPATVAEGPPTVLEHPTATADETISTLFVFMLATFVGLDVIRRVSRLLHTPLMSLTNAISAIAVVGSILVAGGEHVSFRYNLLGLVAIAASVTNIVSGFLITDRMLKMFKRRGT